MTKPHPPADSPSPANETPGGSAPRAEPAAPPAEPVAPSPPAEPVAPSPPVEPAASAPSPGAGASQADAAAPAEPGPSADVHAEAGWIRRAAPLAALCGGMILLMLLLAGTFVPKIAPELPVAAAGGAAGGTAPVRAQQFPEWLAQVGTVRSRYRADVASKLLAQVTEIKVEAGDVVAGGLTNGAVVAVLDSQDLRARFARTEAQVRAAQRGVEVREAQVSAARAAHAAAEAQLDRARVDYERYETLVGRGVATAEQLDGVRAARDVAIAQLGAALGQAQAASQTLAQAREELVVTERALEEVQVLLEYTTLRAPFSGIVTERLVEVGETVSPGQGVVRLEDPGQLELHAAVAESLAARLQLGQELAVEVDALGRTLAGKVREVSPEVDSASRTLKVKLTLPAAAGLRSGLFGRLRVPVGMRDALVVPARAVERIGQLDVVHVVAPDGVARRRFVTLGRRRGDDVEVASGLAAGEQVVLP